jgi:hypothetical protein
MGEARRIETTTAAGSHCCFALDRGVKHCDCASLLSRNPVLCRLKARQRTGSVCARCLVLFRFTVFPEPSTTLSAGFCLLFKVIPRYLFLRSNPVALEITFVLVFCGIQRRVEQRGMVRWVQLRQNEGLRHATITCASRLQYLEPCGRGGLSQNSSFNSFTFL